ncbi:MAG: START domain-containing protein [Bacteroidales bacterium]|nr:START domain-containing protein [Bacteroidales bacterium]
MRKLILTFLFLAINILSGSLAAQENDWEFVKNEEGIKVFRKKTEDSPIKAIKVTNEMETTLSALIALMKDVKNHKNWTYANKNAKILEKHNEFSWMFYGYSDAPWPVLDRDMVIHSTLTQDSVTRVIKNEGNCIPDFIPKNEGVVRIPACHSLWTLTPVGNGKILVSLEIQIDLGGTIPGWLINMVSAKGPFQTIKNMEEQVNKPCYKNAKISYIIN